MNFYNGLVSVMNFYNVLVSMNSYNVKDTYFGPLLGLRLVFFCTFLVPTLAKEVLVSIFF